MGPTVVFDAQPVVRVVEVGTRQEATPVVIESRLRLGPWEAGQDQQQPQTCFHRGLGPWIRQLDRSPEPRDALAPRVLPQVRVEPGDGDETFVESRVDGHHRLNQGRPRAEIEHGPQRRRGWQPSPLHHLAGLETGAPSRHSRASRDSGSGRDGHLDGIARRHVEALEPGCGSARKRRGGRQAPAHGVEHQRRGQGKSRPDIEPTTDMSPARALELPASQACAQSVGPSERCLGEFGGNDRGARHGPEASRRNLPAPTLPVKTEHVRPTKHLSTRPIRCLPGGRGSWRGAGCSDRIR
jgi:hypothetical protein